MNNEKSCIFYAEMPAVAQAFDAWKRYMVKDERGFMKFNIHFFVNRIICIIFAVSSVRINNQYRLEFREIASADDSAVIEICSLTDITNHYK